MSFLQTWHDQLPDSLTTCRKAIRAAADVQGIDPKFGVFAAALLFPAREANGDDDHRAEIRQAIYPDEPQYAKALLKTLRVWPDHVTAARELTTASSDLGVKAALEKLITYFEEALVAAEFVTIDIRDSTVQGAIVNIGGKQYFYGDVVITIIQQVVMTCPAPPEEPKQFGGRDQQVAELTAQLKRGERSAITAMYGLGGIGKTTLASKLANLLHRDNTFRAVLWAKVTRNPDPMSQLQTWAQHGDPRYTLPDAPPDQIALQVKGLLTTAIAQACPHCEPERVLMVLDDVWDSEEGRRAARLLQSAAPDGTTILITTRSQNLAIDLHAAVHALDRLLADDGVQMLQTYPELSTASSEALRALVIALGGHPLALDLAARRVQKAEDPRVALVEHTDFYALGLFAGTAFTDLKLDQGDQREDNLTAVLSYSYEDLSDEDKQRFRALGTLPPDVPFDRSILAALWDVPAERVVDHCDTLRLLSLLQPDPTAGQGWYRQHPLLRAYALALLRAAGEIELTFTRYADMVIEITKKFYMLQPEDWGELTPYLSHVQAVGNALVERTTTLPLVPDNDLIQRSQLFAIHTSHYLTNRREVRQIDWLEMGLAVSQHLQDHKNEARFLNDLGAVYGDSGDKQRALDYYRQALPLRKVVGDKRGEAITLNNIGMVYDDLGDKQRALDYYTQALPLYQAVGDRGGEATTLSNIGKVYDDLGDKQRALDYYRQALPLRQAVGDKGGEAATLNNIGKVYDDLGDKQRALDYYRQASPLFQAVGDKGGEAAILNNIGMVYSALEDPQRALDYFVQALPFLQAVGDKRGEGYTCNNMAWIFEAFGELDKAITYAQRSAELLQQIQDVNAGNSKANYERLKRKRDGEASGK